MSNTKKAPSQSLVLLIVVIGVLIGATSSLFIRYGTAPSLVLAAYRKTIATVLLLPLVLLFHKEEFKQLTRTTLMWCLLAGFFMAMHFFTYFMSVKYTTITASNVLAGTEVLFVALFSFATGKTKFNKYCKLAIVLALIGTVLVSITTSNTPAINAPFGNACGVICAIAITGFTMVSRKIRTENMSNTLFNFLAYGAAAIVLDVMVIISPYHCFGYGKVNYLVALGMAVFCSLMCHTVHTWSLGYIKPTMLSITKDLNPIASAVLGFLVLSEMPTFTQIIGSIVVIASIILYTVYADKEI